MKKNVMCELRRAGFLCLDQLQGGVVKKAYERLKKFEGLDSNSPQILEYKENTLNKLLTHATENTKFYSGFSEKNFRDFPVINKEVIRSQQDLFLAQNYKKDDLIIMFTSGSTGTPFSCYQDKVKKKHVIAELLYYSEKAGYQLGQNLTYIRGYCEGNQRSKVKQLIHNQTLILMTKLDDLSIEEMINKINLGSESTILGYGSTYDSWKGFFHRRGDSIVDKNKVKGIISNGEMLFDDTREAMEKAFNCRCYSRYSNQENGVIGQDDTEYNTFLLNECHYLVEILKMDSDNLADPGEVGRIVLTDLYNYAMPMIRYDTGDVGTITYIKQGDIQKRAINNFGGRKADIIFTCKGELLSTSVIELSFEKFPEIRQFQFIQESPTRYRTKVNTPKEFQNKNELISSLKFFLGEEAEIIVEHVDEIPILASGKRKMVVNMMD